ncbi:MAG: hypothetical protein KDI79_30160, partial [Anaerolineae bacterium]|nr:hypothetical protein [Anaerolineae bacterium]
MTYTLRLHNRGGPLLTPTTIVTIPTGTAFVPGSANLGGTLDTNRTDVWGDPLPDRLRWPLDTLAAGDRRQLRFALTVTEAVTDVVRTVATLLPDAAAQADCASTLFTPFLALEQHGPAQAIVGQTIRYTLVVTNRGLVPARNTTLVDT